VKTVSRKTKRFGTAAIAVGLSMVAAGGPSLLAPTAGNASSHREAPLSSAEPQTDATDLYAFVSPDDPSKVTLISNWLPFQVPAGGPNFYPWAPGARYDINIDNNGDAKADIIYRWKFTSHYRSDKTFLYNTGVVEHLDDPDLNFSQTYDLTEHRRSSTGWTKKLLVNDAIAAPSHVGDASIPDYGQLVKEATVPLSGMKGQTYAGQTEDPFFLDLRVFDLLYGGDLSERGKDTLKGINVSTLALQVPKSAIATNASPIVGVWTTASRKSVVVTGSDGSQMKDGGYVQVSRLGNPLVNEVVIPVGEKDKFNASKPHNDGQFASHVLEPELPKLIEAVYGIPAPATPRNDLVAVFLTGVPGLNKPAKVTPSEMLRLNTSIAPAAEPNRLGVIAGDTAGFPNGRRLADDVVDIAIQVMEGELTGNPNDLGDLVDVNDVEFGTSFPYVALPHSGSNGSPAATSREVELKASTTGTTDGSTSGLVIITAGLLLAAMGATARRRATVRR
jgi:hypothetical protein